MTERKDLREEGNQNTLSSPAVTKYLLSTHYITCIWDTLVNKKAKFPALMELTFLQNVKAESTRVKTRQC